MLSGLVGAGIGALANVGMGLYNAHRSAKEARSADARQYAYSLLSAQTMPKAQRQGLEAAGYNPMLALGHIGGSSAMASHQGTSNVSFDGNSASSLGKLFNELALKSEKARVENIKADTALKEGQLDAVETQRLQDEAQTSLIQSQTDRSDLAYGRDIVGTAADIAGTVGSLYSAKALSDVAKANAATRARNATVNERRLDTNTFEVRRDKNGRRVGSVERTHISAGEPTVKNTPKAKTPNVGALGHSAKSVGSVAADVAKSLMMFAPVAAGVYGVGKLQENADRRIKSDPKSNYGRGYRHFVPRLGL